MRIHPSDSISSAGRIPIGTNTSSNSPAGQWIGMTITESVRPAPLTMIVVRWDDTPKAKLHSKPGFVQIYALVTKRLLTPLSAIIEADGDGYLAQTIDMPLYGFGSTAEEAISGLQAEIESLYYDLMQDEQFSEEWLMRKKLLLAIVV